MTSQYEPARQRLDISRFASSNRRRLSGPALRTFHMIAIEWGLTVQECRLILGYPATSTYRGWKKRALAGKEIVLSVDTLTRISALLGIYRAVRILFGGAETAAGWLRRPNDERVFGGKPPMSLVTAGTQDALMTARRFLDAACLGLHMAPGQADAAFKQYEDSEIIFLQH